ncbi:MAG: DUF4258 domain-containing protein [Bdellovibrionia bacterium]
MTEEEERVRILRDLEAGNFVVPSGGHGYQRMRVRGVQVNDIKNAARKYFDCFRQANGNWKVAGPDLDGEDLTIVCVYDGETIIVTVF